MFTKTGAARAGFRRQNYDSKTWGTFYEFYHTGKKPTYNDVGALQRVESSGHLVVPEGKWFRAASTGTGFLPNTSGTTGVSLLGTSSWYFKEAWVATYRGTTVNVSGNITAYSDERLKDNVKPLENALEKVNKIGGYSYERNDLDGTKQVGVLAQEIEKVLPEVVETNEEGYKSVAYGNISALLIEAIKDLSKENKALQERLEKLEQGEIVHTESKGGK